MIIDDLNRYYRQTWVFYVPERIPVYLQGFSAETSTHVRTLTRRYTENFVSFGKALTDPLLMADIYMLNKDKDIVGKHVHANELDFYWPMMGLRNYYNYVLHSARVSARTIVKGLSSRTISVSMINPMLARFKTLDPMKFNILRSLDPGQGNTHELFREIYSPKFPSKGEAIETLMVGDALSVALSKEFALSFIPGYNQLGIYLYDTFIGSYNLKTDTTMVSDRVRHPSKALIENSLTAVL